MTDRLQSSLSTRCVHGGPRAGAQRPPLVTPVVHASPFFQGAAARELTDAGCWDAAWVYTRYRNPTIDAVEQRLAVLEGADQAALFASGMAAMHAALLALAPGGSCIAIPSQCYGGTHDLLVNGLRPLGFRVTTYDSSDPETLSGALEEGTSVVLAESVSNPTLIVADLSRLAELAHGAGALLLVDATFASPVGQQPLALGADLVLHSATKLLSGHSDVIAGVLAGSAERIARCREWRSRAGGCLDPGAAARVERGLKTLELRVAAQTALAEHLAAWLVTHRAVHRVHHPSLAAHPTHAVARAQLQGTGGVLAFELVAGDQAAEVFVEALRLAYDAPSLGGVETLVSLPARMSHAGLSLEERRAAGIEPGLVRVSCGIEAPEDIERDFGRALDCLRG